MNLSRFSISKSLANIFMSLVLIVSSECYSQVQYLSNLNIQSSNSEPQGIVLNSSTDVPNNRVRAVIGLQRKMYRTNLAGSGNDRSDDAGLWIKGYYEGWNESIPIYLGGLGYQSEDAK